MKTEKIIKINSVFAKEYWKVAWPAAADGIFLNFVLLADLVMVGKLDIAQAAAVGIVSQPKMIMQLFATALGVGITAVIARRKGEKAFNAIHKIVKKGFLVSLLMFAVVGTIAFIFRHPIFLWLGATSDYIDYAVSYFGILILAMFFRTQCTFISSTLLGLGDTKNIMLAGFAGNTLNVIFNYLLIFGKMGFPRLEIKGAAIATVMGEALSFLILFLILRKKLSILPYTGNVPDKYLKPVFVIGKNSFFEQIFLRIGMIILARIIAELGTVSVGTHHYCIILWDIYYYCGQGMSSASAYFSGHSLGEKDKIKAKLYLTTAQKLGFIMSIAASCIFGFLGKPIFSLFTEDSVVIDLGSKILIIIAVLIIPQTQGQIMAGTLRGAGDNRFIAVYSFFVSAFLRAAIAYIFAIKLNFGLYGVWIGFFTDELLIMILSKYRLSTEKWLSMK